MRYAIGWFRDPLAEGILFRVDRVGDDWFLIPHDHKEGRPTGAARVLTMQVWKRLEQA